MNKRYWLALLLSLLATTLTAAPMHDAARAGKLSQVKKLVSQGASVNAPDYYGFTPLLLAQLNDQNITAGWLESKGARDGLPPLTTTIQRYLQYLGYNIASVDGVLGPDTRSAISAFQQQQNLPVNGRVREDWVVQLHNQVQSKIQQRLKTLGYYQSEVDGLMGPTTRDAIEAFQKKAGLNADARISQQLLSELQQDVAPVAQQPAPSSPAGPTAEQSPTAAAQQPEPPAAAPAAGQTTADSAGELSEQQLRHLQIRLQLLGHYSGSLDGQMGPATETAIREFQSRQKLPVTGKISEDWIERLNEEVLRTLGFSNTADVLPKTPAQPAAAATAAAAEPEPQLPQTAVTAAPAAAQAAAAAPEPAPAQPGEAGQSIATVPEPATAAPANTDEPPQTEKPAAATALAAADSTSIPQLFRWEGNLNNLSQHFVTRLQMRLQTLGYDTGDIDGQMGPSTVSAIRTFQEKSGLPVNGRVSESWLPQLETALVQQVQSKLAEAGFDPGPADGAMGSRTTTAISAFQKQMSLPQTESVSDALVAKLEQAIAARATAQQAQEEAAKKAREEQQKALQEELEAKNQREEQSQLHMIQANLQALGLYTDEIDGQLGPATRQAIRKFQRQVKLKADGQPGDQVLARSQSEIVRTVQARLQVLGYKPGPVDGNVGSGTRSAIREFERAAKLPLTGEATPALINKIQQTIDARLAEQNAQKAQPQQASIPEPAAKPAAPATPVPVVTAPAAVEATPAKAVPAEAAPVEVAMTTTTTTEKIKIVEKIKLNGRSIAKLQADLDRLGYDPGPADGRMGKRTQDAIREYQRKSGMSTTGEPSQLLLAKLTEEAAKAPEKKNTSQRSKGGNTEVQGALKFQRASSGALLGCSIKGVQLDRVWCDPFAARRSTSDCKVVLRPNSEVLLVKCS